jgi:hypothetical protein
MWWLMDEGRTAMAILVVLELAWIVVAVAMAVTSKLFAQKTRHLTLVRTAHPSARRRAA